MAISAEHPPMTPPCRTPEPPPGARLQQLIDSGALYIARNLNAPQFATLQAIASRIIGPRHPEHPDSTPIHSILDLFPRQFPPTSSSGLASTSWTPSPAPAPATPSPSCPTRFRTPF